MKKRIPNVGEILKFYDDGKIGLSRRYWAKVKKVISAEEADNIMMAVCDGYVFSLKDIWNNEVDECDWLFADTTDAFVCCNIPAYDKDDIWFARTKEGGWFSMNIQSSWQGGYLDVDNDYYKDEEWTFTYEDDVKRTYK